MKKLFLLAFTASIIVSCRFTEKNEKPTSLGGTCNVTVVIKTSIWKSWVGDSIRAYLSAPLPALPQAEPMFKCGQLEPGEMKGLMEKSRNILQVNISDSVKYEGLFLRKDVFAAPQSIIEINAKSESSFLRIFRLKIQGITDLFYQTERERFISTFAQNNNTGISAKIKEQFGFSIAMPPGYFIAKSGSDYMWIRLEHSKYSQALFFYCRDFTDSSDFNANRIIAFRNKVAKENIPGALPGSYMTTDTILPRAVRNLPFGGKRAVEVRGLWCVVNDYMGGPFVNYTFLSPDNRKLITAEGYVYHPNNPKRDLLLQLESILYSITYK